MQTRVNFVCCVLGAKQKERALKVIARLFSLAQNERILLISDQSLTIYSHLVETKTHVPSYTHENHTSGFSSIYVGLSERK